MRNSKKTIFLSIPLFYLNTAVADDKLVEVLVTAQKRSESIKEVPISVAVISSDTMEKMGILKIEDLIPFTDNIHFTESGLSTQVRIRGIGSGNSQGFEQSVGQYMDGVYYGRAPLFRAPVYDISHVEILRGSQNALFGKDSIAGAVAINTASPTKDFNGSIRLGYNPDFHQQLEEITVSGSVTDSTQARLALHGLQENGYFYNSTQSKDSPDRSESSARLKWNWNINPSFTIKTKIEKSKFDIEGRPYEIIQDKPSSLSLDLIARNPGNTTLKSIPSTYNNILSTLFKQPIFEANADWNRQTSVNETSNNSVNNFTTEGIYSFSTLESHTTLSRVHYSYNELCECDYVPANIFTLELEEGYTQNGFDSYLKNDDSNSFKWLGGIYYQESKLNFRDRFFVSTDSIIKSLGIPLAGTGINRLFYQEDKNSALYGQIKFDIAQDTSLQIDGRYTHDVKDGNKSLTIIDANNSPINTPVVTCTYLAALKVETVQSKGMPYNCNSSTPNLSNLSPGNDKNGSKSENIFTPAISIIHLLNDTDSIFASVKTGHKSGGFDPRSNSVSSFEFSEEKSLSQEIGFRSIGSNDKWENNITLFRTDYSDLQVSQFDGGLGFNVGNAKKTSSNGLELDGRFLVTDNFTINYSAGYVDISYKDFRNGNCYQGQVPNGTDTNGDGKPDLCDYTGTRPGFTPKHSENVGLSYQLPFVRSRLTFMGNVEHVGSYNVHENLDPNGVQEAYYLVNANISYELDRFSLSLIGNNLTNEYVKTYSSNVPLSGSFFGTNTLYSFAKRPRSFSLNANLKF